MAHTALVPVFSGSIQNTAVQLCDARALHTFMQVRRDFSNWIKGRIAKFGFAQDVDYLLAKSGEQVPHQGGLRTVERIDYHLTLDMAKELAMVENNAKGREVRRYFIECERRAHHPTTITPAQQQHLKELVDLVVESGKQKSHAETWARLHRKFGVPRYTELPAAQFHSACLYLKSKIDQTSIATLIRKHLPAQVPALDLTGGPAAQAAHEAAMQYIDNLRSGQQTRWDLPAEVLQGLVLDALMSQRFIVSFGYGQGMSINPIARDAYVLPSSKWASAIESGDAHLPPEELARLHAVVSAKISRSYLLMHSQRKAQPPALT